MSSIAAIGMTSRTVEAMKASSAARRSSSVHEHCATSHSSSSRARVIEARMRSSSGGVKSWPPSTQKKDHVGPSSTRPWGRHQQRLVVAALLGQPPGEHVAGVGERLEAVEDAAGGELHRRHARDRRALRERLHDLDPPAAAGEDDAQQAVDRAGGVEQGCKLGCKRVGVGLEAQALARVAEAVEVVLQREGPAAVEAHDLEGAVAAQQALVGDGDAGLGHGPDLAVDGRKCHLLRGYRTS